MKLRNFKLEEPCHTIGLEGCGRYWDLHNFADFVELKYFTVENTVELRFEVAEEDNPWGDPRNAAKGLILRFNEVRFLKIEQLDPHNTNEDDCVDSLSKVVVNPPLTLPAELRVKENWSKAEDFGLFFELQSGRTIEIHAAAAELIPLNKI
jgi:hypothetical protein